MGERLLCKQEVIGSIPFTSTLAARLRPARLRLARLRLARDAGSRPAIRADADPGHAAISAAVGAARA